MRGIWYWALAATPVVTGVGWLLWPQYLPWWAMVGVVLVCKGFLLGAALKDSASNQSKTPPIVTPPGIRECNTLSPGGAESS